MCLQLDAFKKTWDTEFDEVVLHFLVRYCHNATCGSLGWLIKLLKWFEVTSYEEGRAFLKFLHASVEDINWLDVRYIYLSQTFVIWCSLHPASIIHWNYYLGFFGSNGTFPPIETTNGLIWTDLRCWRSFCCTYWMGGVGQILSRLILSPIFIKNSYQCYWHLFSTLQNKIRKEACDGARYQVN